MQHKGCAKNYVKNREDSVSHIAKVKARQDFSQEEGSV